jgi:hypothetical protein
MSSCARLRTHGIDMLVSSWRSGQDVGFPGTLGVRKDPGSRRARPPRPSSTRGNGGLWGLWNIKTDYSQYQSTQVEGSYSAGVVVAGGLV